MVKIEFREKEKKSIAYDLDKQIGEYRRRWKI